MDNLESHIKITPIRPDEWQADVFIPLKQVDDQTLSNVLRAAKNKIARVNDIPAGLLSYHELAKKEFKSDGVRISAIIKRGEAERGDLVLRIMHGSDNDGTEFEDMSLFLDLFPLKTSGEPLVKDEVMDIITKAGIPAENIDFPRLEDALKKIERTLRPLKNVLVAKGRYPDPTKGADVEYKFEYYQKSAEIAMGKVKVISEQLLCRKTPPVKGAQSGHTVRGTLIPPRESLDIQLYASDGARLLPNNTDIVAVREGIPRIKISQSHKPGVKSIITVSVETVEVVDGSKQVKIFTDKHVEIVNGLKAGSRVVSQGEVLISGNVVGQSSIVASGNVNVSGKVRDSTIVSNSDITARHDVRSSKLMAHGTLEVLGSAFDSELKGYEIRAGRIVNCKVVAGSRVTVDTVSADEKSLMSFLTVGILEHLREKISANQEFIHFARENLVRIKEILGERIIREASPGNVMLMVIIHNRDLRDKGVQKIEKPQMDAVKVLISTVGPMRNLMVDKEVQNREYMEQIQSGEKGTPEVIITTGVESTVQARISDATGEITPEDGAVRVYVKDGKLVKEALSKQTK